MCSKENHKIQKVKFFVCLDVLDILRILIALLNSFCHDRENLFG